MAPIKHKSPSVIFNKTNCYFNSAFCRANGVNQVGDRIHYDLIPSKVSKFKFGIKVIPSGEYEAFYAVNRQMMCHLKSYLNRKGFNMSVNVHIPLNPKFKGAYTIWWFRLPEDLLKVKASLKIGKNNVY